MATSIFTDADGLSMTENIGYGQLPIPQRLDEKICRIIFRWTDLDESTRKRAGETIGESQRFTLLAFSERMASLAVRERSPNLVFAGLLALGVDGWRSDWRDNAVLLSLHYDASLKLDIEPGVVFGKAGKLLTNKVSEAFGSFLQRSEEDKSLKAMGYREGMDNDGFRYIRTW